MKSHPFFPPLVLDLPEADIPIEGVEAWLAQGENFQIAFLSFDKDTVVPEHFHEEQWEIVLEGMVDLTMNGIVTQYQKGDRFYIPSGTPHSATVYKGFCSIAFFNQPDRYKAK